MKKIIATILFLILIPCILKAEEFKTKIYETPTYIIFEKSDDNTEPMFEITGYEDGNLEDVVIKYDSVNYDIVLKDGSICFIKHTENQGTGFIFLPDNIDPL